jgi:hypothetical protein
MDVGDVVLDKDMKRHIITSKTDDKLHLVSVKLGITSTGKTSDYYYYKVASELEFITAFEANPACRVILKSLPGATRFFKVYEHRGDDVPSLFIKP